MYDDLEQVRADLETRLARAATDRKGAMHTPIVVTGDVDARVMVLRAFDPSNLTLRFHTDARAPKVAAIGTDPRLAVLFYDKDAKIQIRARGRGRVLRDGDVTRSAWDSATNFARRCYLGEAPGAPSEGPTSGLPAEFEGIEPSDEDLGPAWENFAVLLVELDRLDWLYLAHTGHVRAQFTRAGDGWEGSWLSP